MPRVRMIVTVYVDSDDPCEGPVGFTSDRACLEIAESVNDRAIGEWILDKVGKLPDDVRLINSVHADGLDRYPHRRSWFPMVEAATEWAGLSLPDKAVRVLDYRSTGSRVIRARTMTPEARMRRLERHPEAEGVLRDGSLLYAPARGPYSRIPGTVESESAA